MVRQGKRRATPLGADTLDWLPLPLATRVEGELDEGGVVGARVLPPPPVVG